MLLPKLTVRAWVAGMGKPGPVCAVATPNAAAAVKIVFVNIFRDELIDWLDVFLVAECLLFKSNSKSGEHSCSHLKSESG